jgi:hypothetical protein
MPDMFSILSNQIEYANKSLKLVIHHNSEREDIVV